MKNGSNLELEIKVHRQGSLKETMDVNCRTSGPNRSPGRWMDIQKCSYLCLCWHGVLQKQGLCHGPPPPPPHTHPSGRAAERVLDGLVEQLQVWLPSPSDVGSPQPSHVRAVQPDDYFTSRCTQLSHCGPS